jgi:uncharacterized membrane protein YvbJ
MDPLMKRCPHCESISPDDEMTCGVCGASIATAPIEPRENIDQERIEEETRTDQIERRAVRRTRTRQTRNRIMGLVFGGVVTILSLVLIGQNQSVYGVPALAVGIFILWIFLVPGYSGYITVPWQKSR